MSNLVGNVFDSSVHADADGNVEIDGSLTVNGATTTVSTTNTVVKDKLIELGNGTSGAPSGDAGIIIERGSSNNAAIIWDESADTFVVGTTTATGASTGDLSVTDAALKTAAITSSGVVTATGFTIGNAVIAESELEQIDGITAGTVVASKAVVVDSNKDVGTIRNLTIDGTFSDGNYTFDTSGNVSGLGTVGCGAITTSGVLDITDTTDASDASGDTGALRTEGGASIAKKAFVGTDLSVGGDIILDDGGSLKEAGGTEAFTFNGSGEVTKIGTSSATNGQFLKYDGNKWIAAAVTGQVAGSVAADDITAGDAAINLATTTGNITIDAQGNDTDIIFKGTDNNQDTTFLTLDGSEAGKATFNAEVVAPSLDISGDVDVDGTLEADAITVGDVALNTVIAGVTVTNATNATNVAVTDESSDTTCFPLFATGATGNQAPKSGSNLTFNSSNGTLGATEFSGGGSAITGLDGSNIGSGTVNAARMAAAQTAITSISNSSLVVGHGSSHANIDFNTDNEINFDIDGTAQIVLKDGVLEPVTDADVDLGSSAKQFKDGFFHGTLEADAIEVNGTALATVIAGTTVTNATNSSHVLVTDNESENEENLITFVENATASTGNVGLEMDGHLTYNPSSGTVTATVFKGNIDAVDGDFDGTLEADAITVGGTNLLTGGVVTSLGTITQDTVTFTSSAQLDPLVIIQNTSNDADAARLRFVKDKGAAGADADGCGEIEFYGDDDAQNNIMFAKIRAEVADASNNDEGGRLMFGVATHDGEFQTGLVIEDGSEEDEIDVIIGNGTNSVVTANGYSKALNGFLVPEQKSVHIETPMLATADHTATGITTLMTASENIAQGDLVYVSGNGTIGKADADAVAKMPAIGLAVAAINQNAAGAVLLRGMWRDDSYNFTAGNRLFVHTDGTVTATAPSGNNDVAQAVGVALSDDVIYFSPDMTLVEITA